MARDKHGKVVSQHCKGERVYGKPNSEKLIQSGRHLIMDKRVSACFPPTGHFILPEIPPLLIDTSLSSVPRILDGKSSTFYPLPQRTGQIREKESSTSSRIGPHKSNPSPIIPTRYTLCIKPDFQNSSFEGSVLIELVKGVEDGAGVVSRIILNSLNLVIGRVVWTDVALGGKHEASDVSSEGEQLTLVFDPPLPTTEGGRGTLLINFSGRMNETDEGFFRVNYLSPLKGEEKFGGLTKFGPTFARKCFPCWDELHYKAKFDISLILPTHFTAISNMPVQCITPHRTNKHLHVIEFATTPVMPTYLLAFAIGEFETLRGRLERVSIGVHTPFGRSPEGQFALNWAQACLKFYNHYFGVPFKMAKLDILSVRTHETGGIGNWGLITCHDSELLLEPLARNDPEVKLEIASIVSQAVARQWIGSLVSTDWWSGLWVIEGLVILLQHITLEAIDPQFQMWDRFVGEVFVKGLEADALSSTHPLETVVHSPGEIKRIFNGISRVKGAAVLRMCQHYLGASAFQRGVQEYLKRFALSTASSTDFLDVLEDVSQRPVRTIFDPWTKQSGFPLITIEEFQCSGTTRSVTIRQEPFLPKGIYGNVDTNNDGQQRSTITVQKSLWLIPIQVSLGRNPPLPVKEFLMDKRTQEFTLEDTSAQESFILNPGHIGFYRVKYPLELLEKFIPGIKSKSLPASDRLGLLNNQHALTSAGFAPTTELLIMLEWFVEETELGVWKEIDRVVGSLDLLLQTSDSYPNFKSFVRFIFRKVFEGVVGGSRGNPGESSEMTQLRTLVLRRLIRVGHTPSIQKAATDFRDWLSRVTTTAEDQQKIPYFRKEIMSVGIDDESYQILIRHFKTTNYERERRWILQSLGFAQSESVLKSSLNLALSDFVTPGETLLIMEGIMGNGFGNELAWKFFMENVNIFQRRFSSDLRRSQLIQVMIKDFVTADKVHALSDFFSAHPFSGTEQVLQESLNRIKIYTEWLKRDECHIAPFLAPLRRMIITE